MAEAESQARARTRRARVILRKSRLLTTEEDLSPVYGAEAVSLVHRLTREAWSLSGMEQPRYTRQEIPWRFVPRPSR